MEKLLSLILFFRILWRTLPYTLGVLGALLIVGYVAPGLSPGMALPIFLASACGLISGLKSAFSNQRNGSSRHQDRYTHPTRNRRRPNDRL